MTYSSNLLGSLPLAVVAAGHEPFSSRSLIFGLLLEEDAETRRRQMELLKQHTDPGTVHETHVLAQSISDLPLSARLPLVELTIPALREMSREQFDQFEKVVELLVEADQKISVFEFALQKLLLRHLRRHFYPSRPTRIRYRSVDPLLPSIGLILSALALAGHDDEEAVRQAFVDGASVLTGTSTPKLLGPEACGLHLLDQALDQLGSATPFVKRQVLLACARSVSSDGEVQAPEAELLRAIADTLDCPMPPVAA